MADRESPAFTIDDRRVFDRKDSDFIDRLGRGSEVEVPAPEQEPDKSERALVEMIKLVEQQQEDIKNLKEVVKELSTLVKEGLTSADSDPTLSSEEAPEDFTDLYTLGSTGRAHRPDGKFISEEQKSVIEANADLIRDNLPEHESAADDDSVFRYKPGYEPEVEDEPAGHIEVTGESSGEQAVEVRHGADLTVGGQQELNDRLAEEEASGGGGGRILTARDKDDYARFAAEHLGGASNDGTAESVAASDDTAAAEAEAEAEAARELAVEQAEQQEAEARAAAKKWYQASGRELFDPRYWQSQWQTYRFMARQKGEVTPDMTREEQEKIVGRRRRNKILGSIAGGAAAIAGIYLLSKGFDAAGFDIGGADVSAVDTPPDLGVESQEVTAEDLGLGETDRSEANELPTVEFVPDVAYDVPAGSGGEALLNRLDVDPREWYGIQDDLLREFPDSFYRMGDGNVGISQPGMLPQEVQEYIKSRVS